MGRKPQPITIELDIDTSPEAHDRYLEAIKYLVRRIRADKAERAGHSVDHPHDLVGDAGLRVGS